MPVQGDKKTSKYIETSEIQYQKKDEHPDTEYLVAKVSRELENQKSKL